MKNPNFAAFIKKQLALPELKRLPFDSFQILPIQRIPRYQLLIKELLKYTEEDHPDFPNLTKSLQKVVEIAAEMDKRKQREDLKNRL